MLKKYIDTSVQLLEGKAFENLYRDITYRMVESKEAGAFADSSSDEGYGAVYKSRR